MTPVVGTVATCLKVTVVRLVEAGVLNVPVMDLKRPLNQKPKKRTNNTPYYTANSTLSSPTSSKVNLTARATPLTPGTGTTSGPTTTTRRTGTQS
jgi:hypothetical protein